MPFENASSLFMLAGVVLAIFVLMRGSAGGWMRSRRKEDGPKEIRGMLGERDRDSALADAPIEVLRWQVEMYETARDLKAELDSKLSGLQALVLMARQEAERLESAIQRAEAAGIQTPRDTLAQLEGLADPEALADSERLSTAATQMPPLPGGVATDFFADNDRSVAIARLADQRCPPAEIARRMGMAVGEVEIFLSLRK